MICIVESPLLCDKIILDMSMYMPGATAVGITFDGGVVFASEKRIAFGNFLVSKTTKKTFSITDKVGATCAGLVADMQILTYKFQLLQRLEKWI